MKFLSVLALRLEVDQLVEKHLESVHDARPFASEMSLEQRHSTIRRALGFGVSHGEASEFQLAIRVQSQEPEVQALVDLIVKQANGEADVRYVGPVLPEASRPPLAPGASIGVLGMGGGTLGVFVQGRGEDRTSLLTCAHVVTVPNRTAIGAILMHPSGIDGGKPGVDDIAVVRQHGELSEDDAWDVAIAELREGIPFDVHPIGVLPWCSGVHAASAEALLGTTVWKFGRSTERTQGVVSAVDIDIFFRCGETYVHFPDLIEVTPIGFPKFSAPGDSGSLVMDEVGHALGLHTAGGGTPLDGGVPVSYSQPIRPILDRFAIELVGMAAEG